MNNTRRNRANPVLTVRCVQPRGESHPKQTNCAIVPKLIPVERKGERVGNTRRDRGNLYLRRCLWRKRKRVSTQGTNCVNQYLL